MVADPFVRLVLTGDLEEGVSTFLLDAGRADTWGHCRRVAATARRLASRFGADVNLAYQAGVCHDLAAVVPYAEAVEVAQALGSQPDRVERACPVLLHGPIAAFVLERLGIRTADLLNAIRYHSTCRPHASPLELVLFVADKIALDPAAPVRDFVPAVEKAAWESLEKAACVYLDWLADHGEDRGWMVHPRSTAALRSLRRLTGIDAAAERQWRGDRAGDTGATEG